MDEIPTCTGCVYVSMVTCVLILTRTLFRMLLFDIIECQLLSVYWEHKLEDSDVRKLLLVVVVVVVIIIITEEHEMLLYHSVWAKKLYSIFLYLHIANPCCTHAHKDI